MKGVKMNKDIVALMTVVLLGLAGLYSASAHASETLTKVENDKVCMVTDMHFPKKQIPVEHNGKTYYGCCENCKATLSSDAKSLTATDPVSGKSVDKASAVIGMRADYSVLYFENEKTLKQYAKQGSKAPTKDSRHDGHAHH